LSDAVWVIYQLSGYISTKRLLEVQGKAVADEKKTEPVTGPPATA
jgi:hypothetical protein